MTEQDPYNLDRFLEAQERHYAIALQELRGGQKRSHWMWFMFPKLDGVAYSEMAQTYAIGSPGEALAYLEDPVLGDRLQVCSEVLLLHEHLAITDIFMPPDHMALQASMTLFAAITEPGSVFEEVLDTFYAGLADGVTTRLLKTAHADV